jgi:MFS family permease
VHRLRPGDRRRRRAALNTLRRAHIALAIVFVCFGTVDGTWSARLPAIKDRLDLDSGRLGLAMFSATAVATLILTPAGMLVSRLGSRLPTAVGIVIISAGLVCAGLAPSYATLLLAAALFGVGIGTLDVSANAHGVAIEHGVARPILSGLHGFWSVGLLTGSAAAAAAAALAASPRVHFTLVGVAVVLVGLACVPYLLRGTRSADAAHFALPRGALALPAFLMFCSFFLETASMNWSAVFLAGPADASAAVAAGGVVAYSVAMAIARFAGDPLTVRWGVGGIAQRGGTLVVIGITLVLATRAPAPGLIGFALVGAGCAAVVPALFRAGAGVAGVSPGAGIAAVATAGYLGGVVNGPAIGFLARGVGLTAAMSLIGVGGALIAILGPRLER